MFNRVSCAVLQPFSNFIRHTDHTFTMSVLTAASQNFAHQLTRLIEPVGDRSRNSCPSVTLMPTMLVTFFTLTNKHTLSSVLVTYSAKVPLKAMYLLALDSTISFVISCLSFESSTKFSLYPALLVCLESHHPSSYVHAIQQL
eukprot:TRINITY_DN10000_c0_g1_i1.p1 TRINITY_DN10000_c0_g1~~TRINITY_DN10000_c0_g1_i1.p1  ORF type:complete len:143 (-),score=12.92 TRINITY_DN10000_c0_g1_i1:131-559(-)